MDNNNNYTVSVVINYCSNERPFLPTLLRECAKFSKDVIVSVGSHLYDGTPETPPTDTETAGAAVVVTYDVDVNTPVRERLGVVNRPTAYWHNLARWTGICSAKHEWVLLLDADEIPDGRAFSEWVTEVLGPFKWVCNLFRDQAHNTMFKMANHWYFRSPCLRAQNFEDSVVLAPRQVLLDNKLVVFGDAERDSIVRFFCCEDRRTKRMVTHHRTQAPMFHHFSYVRPDIHKKMTTWAHRDDLYDAGSAVQAFIGAFNSVEHTMVEPVHGYKLERVPCPFEGLEAALLLAQEKKNNNNNNNSNSKDDGSHQ